MMMQRIRNAATRVAERRQRRASLAAIRHLELHMLKDVGLDRYFVQTVQLRHYLY